MTPAMMAEEIDILRDQVEVVQEELDLEREGGYIPRIEALEAELAPLYKQLEALEGRH